MPRRKKYGKKSYKRRTYRKRSNRTALLKSPMPRKFVTKLRYAEHGLSVDPGAGLNGVYIFRANDLFDPNYSSTGHQPRGFDQLMPMYNHFTVLGSKATFHICNPADAAFYTTYLTLQGEPTIQLNPIDMLERQDVTTRQLGSKSTNAVTTMTKSFSTKKFFSRSNIMDDNDLRGDVGNSPAELAYYHFGAVEADGVGDPGPIYFTVIIDYIVAFHETNDVGSS